MAGRRAGLAKITHPLVRGVLLRKRLFTALGRARKKPTICTCGPAGSGKTTLVASYLDTRKLPSLWHREDERDADIAAFFYYMGFAGKTGVSRSRKVLPLLTFEYLMGINTFTQRDFERLFARLKPPLIQQHRRILPPEFKNTKVGSRTPRSNPQSGPSCCTCR
jgi:LuxR family transcriptional regulator, maltose regulon positive regulatory protein